MKPDDENFSAIFREARVSPPLPPRFEENVWRRIEKSDVPKASGNWLDAIVGLILRPRFAFAAAVVLMFSGIILGAHEGTQTARQNEQASYVSYVAPNPLR